MNKFIKSYLSMEAANYCLHRLVSDTIRYPWEKHPRVPRMVLWFGDEPYEYTGVRHPPRKMTKLIRQLVDKITAELVGIKEYKLQGVLLNKYESGKDSVGFHADDEPELGPDPIIVSLSLGTTRKFLMRENATGKVETYHLSHGDIFIMGRGCQKKFKHSIPKEPQVSGTRINITIRFKRIAD